MPERPSRWCGKCRKVHAGDCPVYIEARKKWGSKPEHRGGRGGRPWRRLRKMIFERDGYQCQMCGRIVTLHGALGGICDHVHAKAFGGTDDPSNLQTLCKPCSNVKTREEANRGRGGSKP